MTKKRASSAEKRESGRRGDPAARAIGELRRAIAVIQAEGGSPDRVARNRAGELLRRLADLPIAMLVADNRGRYVDANAAAAFLTGYGHAELLRRSVWDLTPDAHRGRGEAMWRAFLARERMAGSYPLRRKSGRIVRARYVAIAHVLPGLHVSALATPAIVKRFGRRRGD
jgi:PAS domain S-box-containing protein